VLNSLLLSKYIIHSLFTLTHKLKTQAAIIIMHIIIKKNIQPDRSLGRLLSPISKKGKMKTRNRENQKKISLEAPNRTRLHQQLHTSKW
jgi:hypothetical protein